MGSFLTTTTALLGQLSGAGNDEAWREFVCRNQPILVSVAKRLGLSEHDALDVAQQTLFEFMRDLRAGKFDRTRGRLRSWLVAIAAHRVRDLQRVLARRDIVLSLAANVDLEDPSTLERLWVDEEERVLLDEALQRLRTTTALDPRTVRVFELTALQGVPTEAAASECQMSVDQVYVARNRAATRLREIVAELKAIVESEEAA